MLSGLQKVYLAAVTMTNTASTLPQTENGLTVIHPGRVIVADDHPMFRDVLAQSLARTYPLADIAAVPSLQDAMALAVVGEQVDLFVLDLLFPGMEGEASVRKLRVEFPTSSIVIVTMLEDPRIAAKMMDAGADAFLGKGLSADEMINSINRVRAGEFVLNISSESARAHFLHFGEPLVLTSRQIEIVRLLAENLSNKVMARNLGISHLTVRNHVTVLMRLLGVDTRSQILARAAELGLVEQTDTDRGQQ